MAINLLLALILAPTIIVCIPIEEQAKEISLEDYPFEIPVYVQELDEEKIILAENPDAHLLTPELAAKYGYPVEVHKVTTEDGYILTIHRIMNGLHAQPAPPEGRPVALLQHGLLGSSADFIINTGNKSLAYRLADQGYDIWMPNSRGNRYSRVHEYLNTSSRAYWSFSYHEMGIYDLPACIDYILNTTLKKDLYYVGHSQGVTSFLVCMSCKPQYNSKIRLMSGFSPITYTKHLKGPITLLAPVSNQITWVAGLFGEYELLTNQALLDFFGRILCNQNSPIQFICSNVIFLTMGFDVSQQNTTLLPVIAGHDPAGSSLQALNHYAQGINSGRFCEYDFGITENLIVYGSSEPPDYRLSKITAPVALYWGTKDWLAVEADVLHMAGQLPNLVRKFRVPFNHLDFVFAIDTPTLYATVEEFMKNY